MSFWDQVLTEKSIESRDNISTAEVEYYPGRIVGTNDNEIPQSLVLLNNNCKWIPSNVIKVNKQGIHIPKYIYNQYFK